MRIRTETLPVQMPFAFDLCYLFICHQEILRISAQLLSADLENLRGVMDRAFDFQPGLRRLWVQFHTKWSLILLGHCILKSLDDLVRKLLPCIGRHGRGYFLVVAIKAISDTFKRLRNSWTRVWSIKGRGKQFETCHKNLLLFVLPSLGYRVTY